MPPNKGRAQAWPTNQRLDKADGASQARADRRASQGVRGRRVIPDNVVRMARPASQARKAKLVLKAKPDRMAKPALWASLGCRDPATNKACVASRVRAVKWDHAVKPDRPGNLPRSNR